MGGFNKKISEGNRMGDAGDEEQGSREMLVRGYSNSVMQRVCTEDLMYKSMNKAPWTLSLTSLKSDKTVDLKYCHCEKKKKTVT